MILKHGELAILRSMVVSGVPVKGGRSHTTSQKAINKWYISCIYCQLGDYMPPTTFYGNQKQPLIRVKGKKEMPHIGPKVWFVDGW